MLPRYFRVILVFLILTFLMNHVQAQHWLKKEDKNQKLNFFEIQKKYNQDQLRLKSTNAKPAGWKQYKRWEWYWQKRVNVVTGEFPESVATGNTRENYSEENDVADWGSMGLKKVTNSWSGLGRINCITIHPSDNKTFWIGTPSGGIWKTSNDGRTWKVLNDNAGMIGVSSIVLPSDYETSKTIFIATGDRNSDFRSIGVLKSTDDGETWQETGLKIEPKLESGIGRLLIRPGTNNILYASAYNGIHKSTDGADTWTHTFESDNYHIDMEFAPESPDTMYACTKSPNGNPHIIRSTNAGDTWRIAKTFGENDDRIEMAVTKANPAKLYVVVSDDRGGLSGIYISEDYGETFELVYDEYNLLGRDIEKAYGQGWYDLSLYVSPNDENEIYLGGIDSYISDNGGKSFNELDQTSVHADKHGFLFDNENTLYELNDGGIYRRKGETWSNLSWGLEITQLYRLGCSASDPTKVMVGAQDNGSKLKNGTKWLGTTGGDGMESIIDWENPDYMYVSTQTGEISRNSDGFASNTKVKISENISDTWAGGWTTPYIIDPKDSKTLYAGFHHIHKTTDRGDTWTDISPNLEMQAVARQMDICKSNPKYIAVSYSNGLVRTTDGGSNWENITNELAEVEHEITSIEFHPNNPDTMWVTLGGYSEGNKVFRTNNGGSSWINVSGSLPNTTALSLVRNEQVTRHDELFLGTDIGVFVKAGDSDWKLFSNGLPVVIVNELELVYPDGEPAKLRAATWGRGLWETPVPNVITDVKQDLVRKETKVFPNPTTGVVSVERNSNDGAVLTIVNMKGAKVFELETVEKNVQIDLKHFQSGNYIISVISPSENFNETLIVQGEE